MKYEGFVHTDYVEIANSFTENFVSKDEIGASLCVYHKHEKVVDVWGGFKDVDKTKRWNKDTVVPIFSTTKAVSSACLAMLHSKGLFDYKDKVYTYWCNFKINGKESTTIEELLQHRAGLSAIDKKLNINTINDHELLEQIIETQAPHWKSGDYQGYHVWNIGWYISSLIAKMDNQKRYLKDFLEQEVLSNIEGEIRIGICKDYDLTKIAHLKPFSKLRGLFSMPFKFVFEFFKPWSLTYKSMLNPTFVSNHSNFNKSEILQLEMGAGGGVANARGLASFIDALCNEKHVLGLNKETLGYLMTYPKKPTKGFVDIVFKQDLFRFHAGFMKPSEKHNFSQSTKAFGGFGAGGSFVFHDPDKEVTIAYTMNNMSSQMMNMDREVNIRESVYKTITNKNNEG
ncbi:beta-lactamase family protein [bacterium SCSIO 12643]|nr:beta-lactamase family protein [bacterium SCSIO 12643]